MATTAVVATYGLEIAEIGGTLARHAEDGDRVVAAVLLARPAYRDAIRESANRLGLAGVEFLEAELATMGGPAGHVLRDRLVGWLRREAPVVTLMPEPEHALVDLDPDRRPATTLVLEAAALAGRDWREDEFGVPHEIDNLYFYATHHPTCAVDITATLARKLDALKPLSYQAEYTAEVLQKRMGLTAWSLLTGLAGSGDDGGRDGGAAVLAAVETARALHHGAGGHGRAPFVEVFRHAGLVPLDRLP